MMLNKLELTPTDGQSVIFPQLLLWLQKGGFAIADQGLFAGTNFVVSILLARWLDPAQYGAFAVAYSVFLLLTTFHTAVLTEPMLVFGAGKYADRFPQYMDLLIHGHWWITGVIASLLALMALVIGQFASGPVAQALAGLVFAAPFILLMWLVRRAFYVNGQPQWSASGGLGYLVLMLVGIFELHQQQWLSAALALAAMGIAGLVVSLWLAAVLRRRGPAGGPQLTASSVFVDHWEYGKWAAATTALSWVPGGISYLLLPAWGGLEESAALRAVMNLIMPMVHAFSAVSVLLLPFFVKGLKVEGLTWLYRWVRSSCICLAVISLCSWGVLLVFHKELMLWLYGGRYLEHTGLLILAGLSPMLYGVTAVLGSALRAMEQINQIFWCQLLATFIAIPISLYLLAAYGMVGAIAGGLTAWAMTAVTMVWILCRMKPMRGAP